MKKPDGPFLELNFYCANTPTSQSLVRLVTILTKLEAQLNRTGYAHLGSGINEQPFSDITEPMLKPVTIATIDDLTQQLLDAHTRPSQVLLTKAVETTPHVAEIVTYLSISEAATKRNNHPLAIWTEGELFSGSLRQERMKHVLQMGLQIYQRFPVIIAQLQPSPAAITNECVLECPTDLHNDPQSLAFRDFFVNDDYVGPKNIAKIANLFADAYIEQTTHGIYISGSAEFNPTHVEVPSVQHTTRVQQAANILWQSHTA